MKHTLSISWSCVRSSDFFLQKFSSVEANICDRVPKRWNNIAVNCMTKINAKKNTNTRPIGSNCRYSLEICTCMEKGFQRKKKPYKYSKQSCIFLLVTHQNNDWNSLRIDSWFCRQNIVPVVGDIVLCLRYRYVVRVCVIPSINYKCVIYETCWKLNKASACTSI